MSKVKISGGSSFPFLPLLALLFITLKLTGHITWSWLWVLSPLWIPVAIIGVLAVIWGLVAMLTTLATRR